MDHHTSYNPAMQHMMTSAPGLPHHPHPDMCYQTPPYRDPQSVREQFFLQSLHPALTGGIESYLDPKYTADPAAFASRLPYFPFRAAYGVYDYGFEPAFIRKRNERERQRVKCVNDGYSRLREHLPEEYSEKRLSKVETLRGAIQYIKHLQTILGVEKDKGKKKSDEKTKSEKPSLNEKETNAEEKSEEEESTPEVLKSPVETEETSREDEPEPTEKTGQEPAESGPTIQSACMFSNCDYPVTSQPTYSDVTNDRLCEGWRHYSNTCLYSDSRRTRKPGYDVDLYERSCHYDNQKGIAETDNAGYRFHPYSRQLSGEDFYPPKMGLKQETGPQYGGRNHGTFYCQKFSLGQTGFEQVERTTCYRRSDHRNVILRNYGRGGESDGFKSDNSPGSSCTSTSP